ncbi:MAG: hypothetical protein ACLFVN_11430 [Phycisphaeraceae bacterium]
MKRIGQTGRMMGSALAIAVLAGLACQAVAQGETVVRMTEEPVVRNVSRLGMHLPEDNYHDSPILKKRIAENFEGTIYRQIHVIKKFESPGVVIGSSLTADWIALLEGAEYLVLNGPDQWNRGRIEEVERTRDGTRFVLDGPIRPHAKETAIMVLRDRLDEGSLQQGTRSWFRRGKLSRRDRISNHLRFVNDTAEGSFGQSALLLPGSLRRARMTLSAARAGVMEVSGTWRMRFRTRAPRGDPRMAYGLGTRVLNDEVRPGEAWEVVDRTFDVRGFNPIDVTIRVEGGDVLIDDLEVWQEGDANPTAFRDDAVEVLEAFRPGVVRLSAEGGNSLLNAIRSPMEMYADRGVPQDSVRRNAVGIHDFYVLCEHVGTDAWAVLPPTLTPEEIDQYMSYLGAPADTGHGRLRAELGHPEPWTESLGRIFVQFGSEASDLSGYAGPEYWTRLIERAKRSPYYRDNIVFVVDGEPTPWRVLKHTDNADRLSMRNLLIPNLDEDELGGLLNTDEALYRYVFAWPYEFWMKRQVATDYRPMSLAQREPIEVAISVGGNYDLARGDAPAEPRNRIITSVGGGLSAINSMLMLMKAYGVRTQNLASLAQFDHGAGGTGNSGLKLRGPGQVTNLCPRERRYRPSFLAAGVANEVIGGDLIQTVHEGEDPVFDARGRFDWSWKNRDAQPTTVNVPVIHSYGFREGDRRGLVLISLDVSRPRPVEIAFAGDAAGGRAERWMLTADELDADNEPGHEPEVAVQHEELTGFASGHALELPPFSMVVYEWSVVEKTADDVSRHRR